MESYFFEKNKRTLHEGECPTMPKISDRVFMGIFSHYEEAVKEAEKLCPKPLICEYCCGYYIPGKMGI